MRHVIWSVTTSHHWRVNVNVKFVHMAQETLLCTQCASNMQTKTFPLNVWHESDVQVQSSDRLKWEKYFFFVLNVRTDWTEAVWRVAWCVIPAIEQFRLGALPTQLNPSHLSHHVTSPVVHPTSNWSPCRLYQYPGCAIASASGHPYTTSRKHNKVKLNLATYWKQQH